jgi:hypothetical protein
VIASVSDDITPVPDVAVEFTVSGSSSAAGTQTTDAAGQAMFCYTVAAQPGMDTIVAVAQDGTNPSASASVLIQAGPADSLSLEPAAATRTVGTQHCVVGTVRDARANLLAGVAVSFAVSGASTASGVRPTNASGTAQFCYVVADLPGDDAIAAAAQGGTNPLARAAVKIVAPASTVACNTKYLGDIRTMDRTAKLHGFAAAFPRATLGEQGYDLFALRGGLKVDSLTTDSLVCSAKSAAIFGLARVNGSGPVVYRIDLLDGGLGPLHDRFRIRLGNGYDSGAQRLTLGFVDINK